MAYKRKSKSRGISLTRSLRQQFYEARRNAERRILSDEAFRRAIRGTPIGDLPIFGKFTHLNFDEIFNTGITRKVNGKTVRFTGVEAITLQIWSLNQLSNKTLQNKLFIDRYLNSISKLGVDEKELATIRKMMEDLPVDYLTYLIRLGEYEGGLPSMETNYAAEYSDEEIREEKLAKIYNVLKYREKGRVIAEKRKKLDELYKLKNQYKEILTEQLKNAGGHIFSNKL